MMLGELRGVSAFVTHNLGLHCALPSIVALRALGRVLRRVILSEMKAVRRFFSLHKTGCSSASRRAHLFGATQTGKNNSDRVPTNKKSTNLVLKARGGKFTLLPTPMWGVGGVLQDPNPEKNQKFR